MKNAWLAYYKIIRKNSEYCYEDSRIFRFKALLLKKISILYLKSFRYIIMNQTRRKGDKI